MATIVNRSYVIDREEGCLTVYLKMHKGSTEDSAKKRAFRCLRAHNISFTGLGVMRDVGAKYRFPPLYKDYKCIIYTEEPVADLAAALFPR